MFNFFRLLLSAYAHRTGRGKSWYLRICKPTSGEWGKFQAKWGGFNATGEHFVMNRGCNVTDPSYVRFGSNVILSHCTLLGHDAVVNLLNRRFDKKIDSVGFIDIKDNCFVGHGAIVMPRVTIGPDSIVAAGAVVTKNVPQGVVVGGNPARVICTTEDLLARMEARSNGYPWIELINARNGAFDQKLEPKLVELRVKYFFGE